MRALKMQDKPGQDIAGQENDKNVVIKQWRTNSKHFGGKIFRIAIFVFSK